MTHPNYPYEPVPRPLLDLQPKLDPSEFGTLIGVWRILHQEKTDETIITLEQLSKKTGISERTVRRSLKSLRDGSEHPPLLICTKTEKRHRQLQAWSIDWNAVESLSGYNLQRRMTAGQHIWVPADWFSAAMLTDEGMTFFTADGRGIRIDSKPGLTDMISYLVRQHSGLQADFEAVFGALVCAVRECGGQYIDYTIVGYIARRLRATPAPISTNWYAAVLPKWARKFMEEGPGGGVDERREYPFGLVCSDGRISGQNGHPSVNKVSDHNGHPLPKADGLPRSLGGYLTRKMAGLADFQLSADGPVQSPSENLTKEKENEGRPAIASHDLDLGQGDQGGPAVDGWVMDRPAVLVIAPGPRRPAKRSAVRSVRAA